MLTSRVLDFLEDSLFIRKETYERMSKDQLQKKIKDKVQVMWKRARETKEAYFPLIMNRIFDFVLIIFRLFALGKLLTVYKYLSKNF